MAESRIDFTDGKGALTDNTEALRTGWTMENLALCMEYQDEIDLREFNADFRALLSRGENYIDRADEITDVIEKAHIRRKKAIWDKHLND